MCTVSFLRSSEKVLITSNRDEHISRKAPLVPIQEIVQDTPVIYPKDALAGGTWFAMNTYGMVTVLLNGAFNNHTRKPPYRLSRGLIVLDIISKDAPVAYAQQLSLSGIEPFTLIIFDTAQLLELRWDGSKKHWKSLDMDQGHIWSSWTLYDQAAQNERRQLFEDFLKTNHKFQQESVRSFHQENHGNSENGFVIDRKNGLKTLSVTQAVIGKKELTLDHLDLDSKQLNSVMAPIVNPVKQVL